MATGFPAGNSDRRLLAERGAARRRVGPRPGRRALSRAGLNPLPRTVRKQSTNLARVRPLLRAQDVALFSPINAVRPRTSLTNSVSPVFPPVALDRPRCPPGARSCPQTATPPPALSPARLEAHQGHDGGWNPLSPDAQPDRSAENQHRPVESSSPSSRSPRQETVADILKAIQTDAAPDGVYFVADRRRTDDDSRRSGQIRGRENLRGMRAGCGFGQGLRPAGGRGPPEKLLEIQEADLKRAGRSRPDQRRKARPGNDQGAPDAARRYAQGSAVHPGREARPHAHRAATAPPRRPRFAFRRPLRIQRGVQQPLGRVGLLRHRGGQPRQPHRRGRARCRRASVGP